MKKTLESRVLSLSTLSALLGTFDANVNLIAEQTQTVIYTESNVLKISGEEENVLIAKAVVDKLAHLIEKGEKIEQTSILYCIELARENQVDRIEEIVSGVIAITSRGKQIKAKTIGQKSSVETIKKNEIVFGVGPAGTGKT